MKKTTRRGFLVLLVSGGTALAANWFRGRRIGAITLELRHILAHDAHAEMIGQQYLKKVPAEADPDLLGELILSDLPWGASLGTDTRALVREQVRRDFAEDRVVRLAVDAFANRGQIVRLDGSREPCRTCRTGRIRRIGRINLTGLTDLIRPAPTLSPRSPNPPGL